MKQTLVFIAFITLFISSCVKEEAPSGQQGGLRDIIIINQDIQTNTVWDGDHVYRLTAPIEIRNGANLTIEPGCIIKFNEGGHILIPENSYSSILAIGTPQNKIIFTSNGNRRHSGEWEGLIINEGHSRSSFNHCVFEYSERAINFSGFFVDVDNSLFRYCEYSGISFDSKSEFGSFNNNTFENTVEKPIRLNATAVNSIGKGNTFGKDSYVEVYDNLDYPGRHVWKKLGIPYRIEYNYFTIFSYTSDICELVLEPGVILEISDGFTIGSYLGDGRLIAKGTATDPIIFKSIAYHNSGIPSYWSGIAFTEYTTGTTVLDYCKISHGGDNSYLSGNITVYSTPFGSISISNCVIEDSKQYGIYKVPTAVLPDLSNNTFKNNASGDKNW